MKFLCIALSLLPTFSFAQSLAPLTVEKIMRDPKWIGTSPSAIRWADDSKTIYFNWNPDKATADSLYASNVSNTAPQKVLPAARKALDASNANYNATKTAKVFEKNGDIFYRNLTTGALTQITFTNVTESNPVISFSGKKVFFTQQNNLYSWTIASGELKQLTLFTEGNKKSEDFISAQDQWLKTDQLTNFQILQQRAAKKKAAEINRKNNKPTSLKPFYLNGREVENMQVSPNEQFITFNLATYPSEKIAQVPDYVTETGYMKSISTRSKVGTPLPNYTFWVYNSAKDTAIQVDSKQLPGIYDLPDYVKDYPNDTAKWNKWKKQPREVLFHGPFWSDNGKNAVVIARALDNKDRWILNFDAATCKLSLLDRQRNEAWVGGPCVENYWEQAGSIGWLADNERIWYASETTGYTHIYTHNVATGSKKQLTSGNFEVQEITLSKDKKTFYYISNEVHPGEQHFYKISVDGGKSIRLTTQKGAHECSLSPDEKYIAIRYSYTNKPWELYVMKNATGAKPVQITQSTSTEFSSYNWREPEVITFKATDTATVHARLYKPANANGKAVIFVHGAGYLQNAHYW